MKPVEVIEQLDSWQKRYDAWKAKQRSIDSIEHYPFVENTRSPFSPARRALPMLNLALISSAGAYIDGTAPFDTTAARGDLSFREIPAQIEPGDLRFAARVYDPAAVKSDSNCLLPLGRLFEFESNG